MSFSISSASEQQKHRKQLMRAASAESCGKHRAEVEEVLHSIGSEAAFALQFDKSTAVIDGDGVEYEPELVDDVVVLDGGNVQSMKIKAKQAKSFRQGYRHPLLTKGLKGAAHANKQGPGFVIPCGVVLIVAGGGKGKTPLAHALAGWSNSGRDHEYAVVRIGEPLSGYTDSTSDAALSLGCAMANHSDVVLDSIKDLMSGAEGAAMKSGISRGALLSISGWSSLACDLGCTIYIPVNPSTDDEEVKQLLIEAARSNATAVISMTSDGKWMYSARTGEGLERRAGTLIVTYKDDAVTVSSDSDSTRPVVESQTEFAMRISTTIEDYNLANSRAISARKQF